VVVLLCSRAGGPSGVKGCASVLPNDEQTENEEDKHLLDSLPFD